MRVKNNQELLLFNCSAFCDWLCQLLYQSYVELKTRHNLQVVICIYLHPGQLECFPFMLLWAKTHVHLSFRLCPDQPTTVTTVNSLKPNTLKNWKKCLLVELSANKNYCQRQTVKKSRVDYSLQESVMLDSCLCQMNRQLAFTQTNGDFTKLILAVVLLYQWSYVC